MHKWVKRGFAGIGSVLGIGLLGGGGFAFVQASAFDSSLDKKYDVAIPTVTRSTDPQVLARGKHISDSLGACSTADCHGGDLAGGKTLEMGPLGTITSPNVTVRLAAYSDGELVRLIRHGIKRDNKGVVLMPSEEFGWMSIEDATAVVSYLRTLPVVTKADGPMKVGLLGKILDRQNKVALDVARRIDHGARAKEVPPAPEPTAKYGEYLVKNCRGCHGDTLAGGPIPGAPPSMPVPRNITPHETGLKAWSFEDFLKVCNEGLSKDGKKLDPMMPYEALSKMNEVEKKAMWAYLQTTAAKPFGER